MAEIILETKRIHKFFTGRVQGVGFRDFVQHTATNLGLTGWVRNVGYDQVETVAEGNPEAIKILIENLRTGPRRSRVDVINFTWETPRNEFERFSVRF